MILDTLDRASLYHGIHPGLPKAIAWLAAYDSSTADGRYEIDGPALVAIVQRYETAPAHAKKWETHRLHGDVQFLVSGSEVIGYAHRDALMVRTPYGPEKDAEFYEPPAAALSRLHLSAGSFVIFFPQDGHQPGVMAEFPEEVRKVVIKFRL